VTLYGDETGTKKIWQGSYTTNVVGGVFAVALGTGDYPLPETKDLDHDLWIGVTLIGGEELRPLAAVSAVPLALNVPDGSITKSKLNTEYVGAIAINGTSISGQGGTVNITGSENIDVSYDPDANVVRLNTKTPEALTPNNAAPYWGEQGNNSTNPANGDFLGTSDNVALEIHINNSNSTATSGDGRVMLYAPQTNSANLVGGFKTNSANAAEGVTIGGGGKSGGINQSFDNFGFVGGGSGNTVGNSTTGPNDVNPAIAGGRNNTASGGFSFVGAGDGNTASATHSAVAGGTGNTASGTDAFVGGGNGNGAGNTATTVGGGQGNTGGGNFSTVGGGFGNTNQFVLPTSWSFTGGGSGHVISDDFGTIGGGRQNWAGNDRNNIPLGGIPAPPALPITTDAWFATVCGGWYNSSLGWESSITGGEDNIAGAIRTSIIGGFSNVAYGPASTIGGGEENQIGVVSTIFRPGVPAYNPGSSQYGFIGGGQTNLITWGDHDVIGGGFTNTILAASTAVIGGGSGNTVSGTNSTIGGGIGNAVSNTESVIAGGTTNFITSTSAAIGGGSTNTVSGIESVIAGGFTNTVTGTRSAIAGGANLTLGNRSFGFNGDANQNNPVTNISATSNVALINEADLWVGNVNNSARSIRFYSPNNSLTFSGANFTSLKAAPQAANINYTWPPAIGATGSLLFASNTTGTNSQLAWLAPGPNGSLLSSTGGGLQYVTTIPTSMLTGTIPTSILTGTLPIANGGTGATTQNDALNNILPAQTGNAGSVLQTDGTNASWQSIGANTFLPSQTGNGGKVLGTDGSALSWVDQTTPTTFTVTGAFSLANDGTTDMENLTSVNTGSQSNWFILDVNSTARSYFRVSHGGSGHRLVITSDGQAHTGQILIIECGDESNAFFIQQQTNSVLTSHATPSIDPLWLKTNKRRVLHYRDILVLIFNGASWEEVSWSNNVHGPASEVDEADEDDGL